MRAPLTKPKTLDLIGLSQAASLLGVTSRQMVGMSRREGFPEPIANLKVMCWHKADIEKWAKDHQ